MKIRPLGGGGLFHADGQTDRKANRRDESSNHFLQFCERAQKAFFFVRFSLRES